MSTGKKTIEVVVVNRKGPGSHVETVDFVDIPSLLQRVNTLVEELEFRKVSIELNPSWDVSPEEQAELDQIICCD